MSEQVKRHPRNAPGKYYVDVESCVGCQVCIEEAPDNFKDNFKLDGDYHTYVYKQPENSSEEELCRQALRSCPVWAVHNNGDMHWQPNEEFIEVDKNTWHLSVIAPRNLCYDGEWDFDSNIIALLVHRQGAVLPDFNEIFSFWRHRKENVLSFIKSNSRDHYAVAMEVHLYSADIECVPIFSIREDGKIEEADFPKDLKSRSLRLPLVAISKDVGITAFAGIHRGLSSSGLPVTVELVNQGFILAEERLSFEITSHSDDLIERSGAKIFEKIFASYAREDLKAVGCVNSIISALGIGELRWDLKVLCAGELWEERIYEEIQGADSFQLFWSEFAKSSQSVKKEWEFALKLGRSRFIKPVYWVEPIADRPRELEHLHFSKIDIRD